MFLPGIQNFTMPRCCHFYVVKCLLFVYIVYVYDIYIYIYIYIYIIYIQYIYNMRVALAKSRSVRGASHQSASNSSCLTISHIW